MKKSIVLLALLLTACTGISPETCQIELNNSKAVLASVKANRPVTQAEIKAVEKFHKYFQGLIDEAKK